MKPLGFIIITYNRPADLLALVQNIAELTDADQFLEEIIIVNNASSENYEEVKQFIYSHAFIPFNYIESAENLGVARGRNFALQKSRASIKIMLDDDAVLQNKDCLIQLLNEFSSNNTERPKGVVSFKVLYYDTLKMQKNALPHKQFEEYSTKSFFETYYYAGGAHAIKKEVLEKTGLYPEDFFYGMEEYDMSYRILNEGYSIVYSDKVVMLHKESPWGRKPKEEKIRMMWVNKSKVAYRYLPLKYYYSTALMWSLEYLRQSGFNMRGFFKGWKEIMNISSTETRKSIKKSTLDYLMKLKARLWY